MDHSESSTNHTLYAIADPTNTVAEVNETNNIQTFTFGESGLEPALVGYTVQTNGALRVIASVKHLGGPGTTNCLLAIRRAGQTNAPLGSTTIPALQAGQLAQLLLELPSGTQAPGQSFYTLTADDTHQNAGLGTNYSTATFSVLLGLDSDSDGIPDSWMLEHFDHPTGTAADLSRSQDGRRRRRCG